MCGNFVIIIIIIIIIVIIIIMLHEKPHAVIGESISICGGWMQLYKEFVGHV